MLLLPSYLKVTAEDWLQLLSLGPIYRLLQTPSERCGPQGIFIGRMKGEGPSSVASSGWHWARGPYLTGAVELSPCLVKGPQKGFCCYPSRICVREWLESLHHHHLDMELLQSGRDKLNKQIKKAGAKDQ